MIECWEALLELCLEVASHYGWQATELFTGLLERCYCSRHCDGFYKKWRLLWGGRKETPTI